MYFHGKGKVSENVLVLILCVFSWEREGFRKCLSTDPLCIFMGKGRFQIKRAGKECTMG